MFRPAHDNRLYQQQGKSEARSISQSGWETKVVPSTSGRYHDISTSCYSCVCAPYLEHQARQIILITCDCKRALAPSSSLLQN